MYVQHIGTLGDPWFFFQPFLAASEDLNQEEKAALIERDYAETFTKGHQYVMLGEDV